MLLSTRQLVAGYGRKRVLFGIDLDVHAGEIVCVIGPNGAGKTTLLKSILGTCSAHAGSVAFKGQDITRLPTHAVVRRGVSLCPEGRRILQQLTVEENLIAALIPGRSLPRRDALAAAYEMFPALFDKRKERAGALSGGQQQMLAIARALVPQPELLLLDEPSLGLAPKVVTMIFEKLLTLQSAGLSLMVVDQNVELALAVSDYCYVLESGALALEGPSGKLRDDPAVLQAFLQGVGLPEFDRVPAPA